MQESDIDECLASGNRSKVKKQLGQQTSDEQKNKNLQQLFNQAANYHASASTSSVLSPSKP